jgi:hypothetical protein
MYKTILEDLRSVLRIAQRHFRRFQGILRRGGDQERRFWVSSGILPSRVPFPASRFMIPLRGGENSPARNNRGIR